MKKINTLIILAALAAIMSSCSSEKTTKNESSSVNVEVYQPSMASVDGVSVSGVLASSNSAVLSTRMMAYVDQVLVKQGDKVASGQLLVRLNGSDLMAKRAQVQAQVNEAEAAAKNAQRDYERFRKLHAQHSVSDKELENMELNNISMQSKLEMARQMLKEVNAMLAYTDIRAPFAGTVAHKMVEKGNMAQPGMPLVIVEQPGKMEVRASVPENYVSYAKVGDKVKVDIKSLGCTIDGTISELSTSASLTGGQYTMKVNIDTEGRKDLLSGMFAGIRLTNDAKVADNASHRIWIDEASVVKREQLRGVYVVNKDNRAMLRWVRLGKTEDGRVEVLSGLNSNENVIRTAEGKLYNGQRVSVAK